MLENKNYHIKTKYILTSPSINKNVWLQSGKLSSSNSSKISKYNSIDFIEQPEIASFYPIACEHWRLDGPLETHSFGFLLHWLHQIYCVLLTHVIHALALPKRRLLPHHNNSIFDTYCRYFLLFNFFYLQIHEKYIHVTFIQANLMINKNSGLKSQFLQYINKIF